MHALVLAALGLGSRRAGGSAPEVPAVEVAFAPVPRPPAAQRERALAATPRAHPARARAAAGAPPPPAAAPVAAPSPRAAGGDTEGAAAGEGDDAVGEAELAGAEAAGSGGGAGSGCDMAGRLQAALRRDRLVRAAVAPLAAAPGAHTFKVWGGEWVAHSGQDGRGLAAVREAILWEVGFSPPECRGATMHGLVLLTVPAEAGGEVRLALGRGAWRWSDLLGLGAARAAGG